MSFVSLFLTLFHLNYLPGLPSVQIVDFYVKFDELSFARIDGANS